MRKTGDPGEFPNSSTSSSSNAFSKMWTAAQNLTRSVFPKSADSVSGNREANNLNSNSSIHGHYDGFLSDDDDACDNNVEIEPNSALNIRRGTALDGNRISTANKRPLSIATDMVEENWTAPKRLRLNDDKREIISTTSNLTSSRRRFWTSGNSVASYSRYEPAQRKAPTPSRDLGYQFVKNQRPQISPSVNLFSVVDSKSHSPGGVSLSSVSSLSVATQQSSVKEFALPNSGRNSETKRILLGLERVGGLVDPETRRARSWFQSIPEEIERNTQEKRLLAPPLTGLQTVGKAQVVPRIMMPVTSASARSTQKTMRDDWVPAVPAAIKRFAPGKESDGNVEQETPVMLPNDKDRSHQRRRFAFSKPLPLAAEEKSNNTTAGEKNALPSSVGQPASTSSTLVSWSSAPSKGSAEIQSQPSSVSIAKPSVDTTDKSTFEDYKNAAKWKCAHCHFNNKPDDAVCCQCLNSRSGKGLDNSTRVERGLGWKCNKCQAENPATMELCKTCDTPKPIASNGNGPVSSGVKSKWSCPTCLVSNDISASECVCCKTAQPTTTRTAVKPSESAAASWWCDCCMVKNGGVLDKCVACGTPRPTPSQKSSATNIRNAASAPQLAPPKSMWSCGTCFVSNDASANECACCKTTNPSKKTTAKPTEGAAASWWCNSCMVKNDGNVDKCIACGTERQQKVAEKTEGEVKKLNKWTCTTCCLSNSGEMVKCIACQSPKPGVTFKPVNLGMGLFSPVSATAVTTILPAPAPSATPILATAASTTASVINAPKFGIAFPAVVPPAATQVEAITTSTNAENIAKEKPPKPTTAVSTAAPASGGLFSFLPTTATSTFGFPSAASTSGGFKPVNLGMGLFSPVSATTAVTTILPTPSATPILSTATSITASAINTSKFGLAFPAVVSPAATKIGLAFPAVPPAATKVEAITTSTNAESIAKEKPPKPSTAVSASGGLFNFFPATSTPTFGFPSATSTSVGFKPANLGMGLFSSVSATAATPVEAIATSTNAESIATEKPPKPATAVSTAAPPASGGLFSFLPTTATSTFGFPPAASTSVGFGFGLPKTPSAPVLFSSSSSNGFGSVNPFSVTQSTTATAQPNPFSITQPAPSPTTAVGQRRQLVAKRKTKQRPL